MYVALKRSASISAFVASMSVTFAALAAAPNASLAGSSSTWAGMMNEAASDVPQKIDPRQPEPTSAAKRDAIVANETPTASLYRGVSAPDPMFKTWQLRANAQLRLESNALVDDAGERTASNPDHFIIVCEAGCRPRSDPIVSRVSRSAQKLASVDRFQRKSDAALQAGAVPQSGMAQAVAKAIDCVAGCYQSSAQLHWIREGRAEDGALLAYRKAGARVATAATTHGASNDADRRAHGDRQPSLARHVVNRFSSPQIAYNGAIVGPVLRRRVSNLNISADKSAAKPRWADRAAARTPMTVMRTRRPQSQASSWSAFSAGHATASVPPPAAF